ncbi:MAG: peptidoglycan-binding protein LysM [Flavobacteriaceae bacterium]
MKHRLVRVGLLSLLIILGVTAFSSFKSVDLSHYLIQEDESFCYNVPNEGEVSHLVTKPQFQLFLGKTYVGFKEALAFKESQGNYSTVNPFGYLGKYQFAKTTLHLIGVKNSEDFLNDTRLQEEAFDAYTAKNKWILRKDIKRYAGSYINGVKVTESGILAAAHLAGAGNVKKYLRSGGAYEFEDAFGTSIRYYLKKFSGYDTSRIKAQKQASVF